MPLKYQPTPVQEIHHATLEKAGVQLLVKREDLNHAEVSGNKWWKLKYNLDEAIHLKKEKILTFGGAYSNHIFATAAATHEIKIPSIGIIRGEETLPLNATLRFAKEKGMEIHYLSREKYRLKGEQEFILELNERFGDFYLIPEGGTNNLAVQGCEEFARNELQSIAFDHLLLPVGTGGTIAGLICGLRGKKVISGITILKNGEFLEEEIKNLILNYSRLPYGNWSLLTSYHQGGYAKLTKELLDFVSAMKEKHNLPLDTVYTGKLMWAVMRELEQGRFRRGTTVLALHTGGLQNLT
jgi:1-aminocyclopropane-1-carboxylate deaminase